MPCIPLRKLHDLPPGEMAQATLPDGTRLALYNVGGAVFATSDVCTHGEVSLAEEGSLNGKIVECGWHFGAFDVTTGEPTAMPCSVALQTYEVKIDNDMITVLVP